jgi:hypothetical protein
VILFWTSGLLWLGWAGLNMGSGYYCGHLPGGKTGPKEEVAPYQVVGQGPICSPDPVGVAGEGMEDCSFQKTQV